MINVILGGKCRFRGNPGDLVVEYMSLIRGFNALLTEKIGEEAAKEVVTLCEKTAFAESQEEMKFYCESIADILSLNVNEEAIGTSFKS